ncbi:ADP-ribose pyrophosphatase [Isoptericola jiangsuensis]|uniref:ADP-ribose pyrophosphatase n=1 Tax=Isoptericola jiangsuensis TaxID=548579 RepID=A0A2A9EXD0_9MICO|nr:NUDIX hydrolase [Isoptericola jiangsuensis]PFG42930.1 ADP-ribose pyrophosphatase [Isoptericola jiangsuensis]
MTTAPQEPVADRVEPRPVLDREVLHTGAIFDLVRDRVDLGGAGTVSREYLDHPGAVAVVVLDEQDRVLLLRQYRHAVRTRMWEIPAGLLDVVGEPAVDAAARELAEEADLTAARWDTLVDFATTPGASNEALRVFLARDVAPVPDADRHERTGEEAEIVTRWVPLDDAVALVLAGELHNPAACVGVLAAAASRAGGWTSLRAADAAWPHRRGTLPD